MKRKYSIFIVMFTISFLSAQFIPIHSAQETSSRYISGTINGLDWNPNGEVLAISGSEGLWLVTDQSIQHIEMSPAQSVNWNPTGSIVAISRWNGDVDLYETENWSLIGSLDTEGEVVHLITSLNWSFDGNYLATFSRFPNTSVELWDIESGEVFQRISVIEGYQINDLDWHSNEYQFVAGYAQGLVHLYSLVDGEFQSENTYDDQPFPLGSIAWQPNGELIAVARLRVGCADVWDLNEDSIFFWNFLADNQPTTIRTNQCGYTHPIAWSRNGTMLAVTDQVPPELTSNIEIHDIETNSIIYEWNATDSETIVAEIDWNPENNIIAYRTDLIPFLIDASYCATQSVTIKSLDSEEIFTIEVQENVCALNRLRLPTNLFSSLLNEMNR